MSPEHTDLARLVRRSLISNLSSESNGLRNLIQNVRQAEDLNPQQHLKSQFEQRLFPVNEKYEKYLEELALELCSRHKGLNGLIILGSIGKGGALIRETTVNTYGIDLDVALVFDNQTKKNPVLIDSIIADMNSLIKRRKDQGMMSEDADLSACPANLSGEYHCIYTGDVEVTIRDFENAMSSSESDLQAIAKELFLYFMPSYPEDTRFKLNQILSSILINTSEKKPRLYSDLCQYLLKELKIVNHFPYRYHSKDPLSLDIRTKYFSTKVGHEFADNQTRLFEHYLNSFKKNNFLSRVRRLF